MLHVCTYYHVLPKELVFRVWLFFFHFLPMSYKIMDNEHSITAFPTLAHLWCVCVCVGVKALCIHRSFCSDWNNAKGGHSRGVMLSESHRCLMYTYDVSYIHLCDDHRNIHDDRFLGTTERITLGVN